MKRTNYLLFAMCTASGVCWAIQQSTLTQLRARISAMPVEDDTLIRLHREHSRLQALLKDAGRPSPASPTLDGSSNGGEPGTLRQEGPSLMIGSWSSPAEWRPCGNATPDAAIESTFCAAAHGDLNSLKATLEFDGTTLAKAELMLAGLPESSRRQYGSPEELLTVIVAGSVPLDSALLVARQDDGSDNVTEYVRMKNAEGATRQVSISLHRGPDGWRLLIPDNVTDQIGAP